MNFRKVWRNKLTLTGGLIILLIFLMAFLADIITTYHPHKQDMMNTLLSPGEKGHFLGTDEFGRDLWARLVYGSRISIQVGLISVAIGFCFGCMIGVVSGYFGGNVDMLIGRVIDIMMAFPPLLLALQIVAILGPSLINAMIAIGVTLIPRFYRVVRASTLIVKERSYVLASKAVGRRDLGIILRHILPNILSSILVVISLAVGNSILTEAELSFLGLGAQPPLPSWGSIVSGGKEYMDIAPWISGIGGLAIMLAVLGSNLLGDGLRDILDPKLKK